MGWLELLPLLRRVLPLLDRLAPMLESLVAGRVGGRAALEANAASVSELAKHNTTLQAILEDQRVALEALNVHVKALRTDADHMRADFAQRASHTDVAIKTLRNLLMITVVMLAVCLAMLLVLFLRPK